MSCGRDRSFSLGPPGICPQESTGDPGPDWQLGSEGHGAQRGLTAANGTRVPCSSCLGESGGTEHEYVITRAKESGGKSEAQHRGGPRSHAPGIPDTAKFQDGPKVHTGHLSMMPLCSNEGTRAKKPPLAPPGAQTEIPPSQQTHAES